MEEIVYVPHTTTEIMSEMDSIDAFYTKQLSSYY